VLPLREVCVSKTPPIEFALDVKEDTLAFEVLRDWYLPVGPDLRDPSCCGKGNSVRRIEGENVESKLSIDLLGEGEDMVCLPGAPDKLSNACGE